MLTTVDDTDYLLVSNYSWYIKKGKCGTLYARTRVNGKMVDMHVQGFVIDHQDGNGLNNQRSNLRWATHSLNNANRKQVSGRSKFKGVSWHKGRGKWQAKIKVNRSTRHLGLFPNEEDAARAYDAAALVSWGNFAAVNFSG